MSIYERPMTHAWYVAADLHALFPEVPGELLVDIITAVEKGDDYITEEKLDWHIEQATAEIREDEREHTLDERDWDWRTSLDEVEAQVKDWLDDLYELVPERLMDEASKIGANIIKQIQECQP